MSDRSNSPAPKDSGDDARRSRSPSPRGGQSPRGRSPSPANGRDDRHGSPARDGGDNGASRDNERGDRDDRGDRGGSGRVVEENPGNNVYVANLPLRMTEAELDETFAKFGRLQKCEVILDPVTRESRGFAFVTFEDVRDAEDAVKEMHGKDLQGRRLRVEIAKRRRGHEKTPGKYLGPRLASSKYGRDGGRDSRDRGGPRDRSRSRGRGGRSRSRSRDRHSRGRYEDRDRGYDRRGGHDDRRGGRRSEDRYDDRRSRR